MPIEKKAKFSKCPCVGATLDKLIQPAVLAILTEGPLHGYELARRIHEIPNFVDEQPDVSGIYRLMKSLETRGMVVSELVLTEEGRSKRVFTITAEGIKCLEYWNETLKHHRKAIDSLLKTTQKALNIR